MAALSFTNVLTGFWTDFSTTTVKTMTPSADIPVGHRAFLMIITSVDGGVAPNATGWGAIDDSLTDSVGNTWHRDGFGGPVDANDVHTTCEIWSAYVSTLIPASGYTMTVIPDSRGLSAYYLMLDVAGLLETGGAGSPLDASTNNKTQADTVQWASGQHAQIAQPNEWTIAVFGDGTAAPGLPWFTDAMGWTSIYQTSGVDIGSARGFAVMQKTVNTIGEYNANGTIAAANSGAGCIATYKLSDPVQPPSATVAQRQSISGQENNVATNKAVTFARSTLSGSGVIVHATSFKTGAADPGLTVADNFSNVYGFIAKKATAGGGYTYLWNCPAIKGGASHTVTVTANATAFVSVAISEWTGLGLVDQINASVFTSSGSMTPGSVTTLQDGELYFCALTEDSGTTMSAVSAGWVMGDNVSTGQPLHNLYSSAPARTVNPTVTWTVSTASAGIQATFLPGPSASFRSTPLPILAGP